MKETLDEAEGVLKQAEGSFELPVVEAMLKKKLDEFGQSRNYELENAERFGKLIGKPSEDWKTEDLAGHPRSLEDYRGKVVVLDFWYRGCGWCIRAMPQFKQLSDEFPKDKVAVIGMNNDGHLEDAQLVIEKMGLNYETLKNGSRERRHPREIRRAGLAHAGHAGSARAWSATCTSATRRSCASSWATRFASCWASKDGDEVRRLRSGPRDIRKAVGTGAADARRRSSVCISTGCRPMSSRRLASSLCRVSLAGGSLAHERNHAAGLEHRLSTSCRLAKPCRWAAALNSCGVISSCCMFAGLVACHAQRAASACLPTRRSNAGWRTGTGPRHS